MKFAEQMGIQVFETSAKDNKNVEEVCDNLVNLSNLSFAWINMTDYRHFSLEDIHNNIHCTRILLEQIIIQPI